MLRTTPTLDGRVVALVALVSACPLTVIGATEITVDTAIDADANDGFCSLREAILAADSNTAYKECPAGSGPDRIAFDLSLPATILLGYHLPVITESLVIIGPGAAQLALDGDSRYRPLAFDTPGNNGTLYVADLTVTHGRTPVGALAGGGAYIAEGERAVFRRVSFIDNRAEHSGGGLAIDSGAGDYPATVTLLDCLFADNVAEGSPGAAASMLRASVPWCRSPVLRSSPITRSTTVRAAACTPRAPT